MRGLDKMKARLGAVDMNATWSASVDVVVDSNGDWVADADSAYTAELIANAPTDMRRLIARVERLEKALEEIRDFDPHNQYGCVDEWEEAAAFGSCVNIASTALAEEDGE